MELTCRHVDGYVNRRACNCQQQSFSLFRRESTFSPSRDGLSDGYLDYLGELERFRSQRPYREASTYTFLFHMLKIQRKLLYGADIHAKHKCTHGLMATNSKQASVGKELGQAPLLLHHCALELSYTPL